MKSRVCAKRPKGVGDMKIVDPSRMPRRCKERSKARSNGSNAGAGIKYEVGQGGVPTRAVKNFVPRPRSHKTAGWA